MQDLGNETGGADKLASLNPSFARGLQTGGLTKPFGGIPKCAPFTTSFNESNIEMQ